ncbi:MAG: hypothetical protein SWJ54_10795 [Cyanobacteriota bacterium]|nr:hypothetical protein [Cyanobacteriota bacterium]
MLKLIDDADRRVCQQDTDLCIEGFPRSANSFTFNILKQANPDCKIVSHSHQIDNIKLAVAYGIPTIILIRSPIQAVASFCVFKHPIDRVDLLVKKWISYYRNISKLREQVVIIDFEIATKDINLAIKKLNETYTKEFKLVEDLDRVKDEFFAARKAQYMESSDRKIVRQVSIPVSDRSNLKKHYVALLEKHPEMETALEIYTDLISV